MSSYEHAGAVHRRRHGRRGIGQHGHLLVERFDERHAEAFVLAGAQKQIGDVVVRDELFVGHVPDEMHVRAAELLDQMMQRRQVALEHAEDADNQQARPRVEERVIGVEEAG